jgi:Prophage CP4-57 regulatory protein (AlpA)
MTFHRLSAVKARYGNMSTAGVYKAMAEGRFPRPVPLFPGSRAKGWRDGSRRPRCALCCRAGCRDRARCCGEGETADEATTCSRRATRANGDRTFHPGFELIGPITDLRW